MHLARFHRISNAWTAILHLLIWGQIHTIRLSLLTYSNIFRWSRSLSL